MSLIVEVKEGKLQGKENLSVLSGKRFYTFQGIPYAQPPVGELRFQPPLPITKWDGIYDATYERNTCIRFDDFVESAIMGSEDCLYLNISTPEIPANIAQRKAVMIFIHGGGFCRTSGSEDLFSADFLMDHDVILVTMNYRLHIFGFLNLGIPDCPGNVGLKDQVQAITWVKENIQAFGGDAGNITLFGQSAGASSIHYHMLSPMSKGLFNKTILQSGSAFSPWAQINNPYQTAFTVGKRLGYEGENFGELLRFLKKQDASDLTKLTQLITLEIHNNYPCSCYVLPFIPSVEEIREGAFLPDTPENLLEYAQPIPTIIGVNDKEGLMGLKHYFEQFLEKANSDFDSILSTNFNFEPEQLEELSRRVKHCYFGNKEVGIENYNQLLDLYADILFYRFYEGVDFIINSTMPLYVYEFSYDGNLDDLIPKPEIKTQNKQKFIGAAHAAELPYLFHSKIRPTIPKIEGNDLKVIKHMTSLWTNFAKTGDPSNHDVTWKPHTNFEPKLLKINTRLKLTEGKIFGNRLDDLKTILGPSTRPINLF